MSRFLSKSLQKFDAYVPGEQPKDKKYIKLNTNESPFGPSDGVKKLLKEYCSDDLKLYPDPTADGFKKEFSKLYGVEKNNISVTNGSDEIINFALMAFGRDKGVCFADITYSFYSVVAELQGIDYEIIPLKENFEINPFDYLNKNKMIVIVNPNAPTGLYLSLDTIEKILKANRDSVVLIDEAYVDFGSDSAVSLISKYDNLLVIGTFSKFRSLAGGRIGFAVGNSELIRDIEKVRCSFNPYNVNRLTLALAEQTLADNDYYVKNAENVIETREYLKSELKKRGFSFTDSKANFIFARTDSFSGEYMYKTLKDKGILVRYFSSDRLKEYVRITIGSRQEIETLIEKIDEIMEEQ